MKINLNMIIININIPPSCCRSLGFVRGLFVSSVFVLLVLIRAIHFEAIISALGNLLIKFRY